MHTQDLRHAYAVVRGELAKEYPPRRYKDKIYTDELDVAMLEIETKSDILGPEMYEMMPWLNTISNFVEMVKHHLKTKSKEFVKECIEHELRASGPQTRNRLIRYCEKQTNASKEVIEECIDQMHEEETIVLEDVSDRYYDWNYEKETE